MHLRNVTWAILVFPMFAFAQNFTADDADPFQIAFATGLNGAETYINISNSGSSSVLRHPDNICVSVYAFNPSGTMLACCSCLVTPNSLFNFGVNRDILSVVPGGVLPTSAVIKLLATLPPSANIGCFNNAATASSQTQAAGLLADIVTTHLSASGAATTTAEKFHDATLSQSELNLLTTGCSAVSAAGAVCNACRSGGQ